jgi:hypothetical protein
MAKGQYLRRRGRAWLSLASFLVLFIFCQIGLHVVFARHSSRDPEFAHRLAFLRKKTKEAGGKPLTVALVGSSRIMFGLRSQTLAKQLETDVGQSVVVVNFGMTGSGPIRNLMMWERLRAHDIRPNLLVVEILLPLLAGNGFDELNEVAVPYAKRYWSDLAVLERYRGDHAHLTHLRRKWLRESLVPWHTHRLSLVSQNTPFLLPFEQRLANSPMMRFPQGSIPGEIDIESQPEDKRAKSFEATRGEYIALMSRFMMGEKQVRAIREMLASCRKEGVPVMLLLMPEGPRFREWYPSPVWRSMEDLLGQLAREFNVTIVNARDWVDDESAFLDSHHLLSAGAAKTTARLEKELLALLLRHAQTKRSVPH